MDPPEPPTIVSPWPLAKTVVALAWPKNSASEPVSVAFVAPLEPTIVSWLPASDMVTPPGAPNASPFEAPETNCIVEPAPAPSSVSPLAPEEIVSMPALPARIAFPTDGPST